MDKQRGLSNIQYFGAASISLLSACGGGGDAAAPPACIPVDVVVQLEGDSISTGAGTSDIAFSPEYLLRAQLLKRWPTGVSVVLSGIGGTTSFDRIDGTGGYAPFPAGVVGNVYLTEFGVNDARHAFTVSQYKANIRKLASVPGAVLQTPTPMVATLPLSNGQSTAAYAQAVREVGLELGVPVADVQSYVLALPNWQLLLVDGVHPGDALYRLMVRDVVGPAVERQVARLRCQA